MRTMLLSIIGSFLLLANGCGQKTTTESAADGRLRILCTTFPMYQLTRNVTKSVDATVDLMLPAQLGCPHSYAMTPQDMQKLSKADLLVINGLGLEEFLSESVKKQNPNLRIVDTSANVEGIIKEVAVDDAHAGHGPHCTHHHHEADHSGGENPHLFAGPTMAAKLVQNIAKALAEADAANAAVYQRNAAAYVATLNALSTDFAELGKRLKNNRIVQPHGVFDYLARDIGLEIVAVMQEHGQQPSAAGMLELVKTVNDREVGAIFIEPQYPENVGKALSKETGVTMATLDPGASGEADAGLDHYESVMRKNMQVLERTLGVQ